MNIKKQKRSLINILPIFDTAEYLEFDAPFPPHLTAFQSFESDYQGAYAFLYAYKDNHATFNAYRREIERLLHWSWQIRQCPIFELKRTDIEAYIKFCQKPPKRWIGLNKPPRFIDKNGKRQPNPNWRPFVATINKTETRQGKQPNKNDYTLSSKSIREIFTVLSSFYQFLMQENYTTTNPVAQVRQKSKFIRYYQGQRQIRRLSDLQWSFVIETAEKMAEADSKDERTLFIISALYLMYLRISELVVTARWSPQMNDFKCDQDGNWWFITVGKGNKERQIAVSQLMLAALKRWRKYLGLPALPAVDEHFPLIPKHRGQGGITSTNQIRNIVQICFNKTIQRMITEGFKEDVENLKTATVHWLRHTGISDDVKRRPREHVRDDAGHSSSQTTDRYIDIDLRERHQSAKSKPIKNT
ncbi:MAG: site-specific integrase [Pseudomonadota bacterium]